MPFTEGNTYGKGRPQGSKNKLTLEIKEALSDFLHDNLEDLRNCVQEMKGEERFNAYMRIAKYVIPTMKAVDMTVEADEGFKPVTIVFKNEKETDK